MLCTDCYFLHNKHPLGGRDPKSCSDLGEQPNNQICESFRPRGIVPNLPLLPEVQLDPDKEIGFNYAVEFRRVIGEQLQIERDLFHTVADVQAEFFQDQSPATFGTTFERYVQKLADLRLLHILTGLFECDVYRDSIMAAEIERQFGVKPNQETINQIQKSAKEMINARIPLVPNPSSRTPVGGTVGRSSPRTARNSAVPSVAPSRRTAPKS